MKALSLASLVITTLALTEAGLPSSQGKGVIRNVFRNKKPRVQEENCEIKVEDEWKTVCSIVTEKVRGNIISYVFLLSNQYPLILLRCVTKSQESPAPRRSRKSAGLKTRKR